MVGTIFLNIMVLAHGASHQGVLRVEPHYYGGLRGNEPLFQSNLQGGTSWKGEHSEVQAHFEFESRGRYDRSIDIDRAWTSIKRSGLHLYFGRIHPWDVSDHMDKMRPWGLNGSDQPQNRGISLGYANDHSIFPAPVILGWVGGHLWLDATERFGFGVSATPFFIPTLGSEVSLSETAEASAGRFGRRPPGYLDWNGKRVPIRYSLDNSRIWEDVILKPQVMFQSRFRYPGDRLLGWAFVSYAPAPDPIISTDGYLRVDENQAQAVAVVAPKFLHRWQAGLTHDWNVGSDHHLYVTAIYQQEPRWGIEIGVAGRYFETSYLDWVTEGNDSLAYADELIQFEARYPLNSYTPYAGFKRHLRVTGSWYRVGLRADLGAGWAGDLGGELFGGGDESFFGEWRTNDRVYGAIRWAF